MSQSEDARNVIALLRASATDDTRGCIDMVDSMSRVELNGALAWLIGAYLGSLESLADREGVALADILPLLPLIQDTF